MTARTYERRHGRVQALRYDGDNRSEIAAFAGREHEVAVVDVKLLGPGRGLREGIAIRTPHRTLRAAVGDWIVREDETTYTVMPDHAFHAAYAEIDPAAPDRHTSAQP